MFRCSLMALTVGYVVLMSTTYADAPACYHSVVVFTGREAGSVERNAAQLLVQRLLETGQVQARVEDETASLPADSATLPIWLGTPKHHETIRRLFDDNHILPFTAVSPGPEGYLLQSFKDQTGRLMVLAAGVDERGVVFAVGEVLRKATIQEGGLLFPADFALRTAPAFEVRGTQIGQSGVMLEKAKARKWTEAEREHAIADSFLSGANTISAESENGKDDATFRFAKSLGMKVLVHYTPNVGTGPKEWLAKESIGRLNYLCPSIPEARQALLKKCEDTFRDSPDVEYVRLVGGDGGGCECDQCKPFGGVFIRLCADMADIIHRYHPKTEIFITNQKFDNASDQAIFAYLQENPRSWLRAFCYGPGSDAMSWQPGHRQTHRMDLFQYPGYGPPSRYLHEILHQLPPQQDIVFYNEITHWRYSEFGFIQASPRPDKNGDHPPHWGHYMYERMPERYLTMVYDRLSFFAWPRFYHRMFNETVRYGIGDVTHSSGTHDHFNQWMWQRLLWDPQQSVEAIVDEYARTWFGPEAAASMAAALFQLEQNMQDDPQHPLPQKEGVNTYYDLVKNAGEKMPAFRRKTNWLWLEHMQKAAIEKHTALAVRQQQDLESRIEARIDSGMKCGKSHAAILESLSWLDSVQETPEMQKYRNEALQWGEESNTLYGVRSEGLYNLDHDFIGLGWTRRQLERAKTASGNHKKELLSMLVDYANPGEGGFYDDCGTGESMPHLVNGYPYDFGQPFVAAMLSESNRRSQRTICSTQDEAKGVAFQYDGLDPKAQYTLRVTLVRPTYQERYKERMNQKAETIYADDMPIVRGVAVPEHMSDYFTFKVPKKATRDGSVTIRFEKMPEVANGDRIQVEQWRNTGGWGTIVSEIWLMKAK